MIEVEGELVGESLTMTDARTCVVLIGDWKRLDRELRACLRKRGMDYTWRDMRRMEVAQAAQRRKAQQEKYFYGWRLDQSEDGAGPRRATADCGAAL